jgi:hypothetical protein
MEKIRAIIVDDEKPARRRLRELLENGLASALWRSARTARRRCGKSAPNNPSCYCWIFKCQGSMALGSSLRSSTFDKDGILFDARGGPYTMQGEKFEVTSEYGLSEVFKVMKGKPQSFVCKVEGNKWYHSGTLSNRADYRRGMGTGRIGVAPRSEEKLLKIT